MNIIVMSLLSNHWVIITNFFYTVLSPESHSTRIIRAPRDSVAKETTINWVLLIVHLFLILQIFSFFFFFNVRSTTGETSEWLRKEIQYLVKPLVLKWATPPLHPECCPLLYFSIHSEAASPWCSNAERKATNYLLQKILFLWNSKLQHGFREHRFTHTIKYLLFYFYLILRILWTIRHSTE